MRCIAFDLGASSGKLYLGRFDGSRLALETVHRFANGPVNLAGSLYWDFLSIYQNMLDGIRKAAALSHEPVQSVGIDSFCNDYSLINRNHELLFPVRCYRDRRTQMGLTHPLSPWERYTITGNQDAPFNTLSHLAAMVQSDQGYVLEHAHQFLFLPDLLGHFLTGESVSEFTVASVSQLCDCSTKGWSLPIRKAYHLPNHIFCPVVQPGTVSGQVSQGVTCHSSLAQTRFVSVCQHDTASAYLASPCEGSHAIISSGTWSLVGMEVQQPMCSKEAFRYNLANEGSLPGHHRLLRNVMGLWLMQELQRDLARDGEILDFAQMSALAEQAKPFQSLIDVDAPEFFPPGDVRQKIRDDCIKRGQKQPETPGEFSRCIYEGLALKYRWAIERLEEVTGTGLPVISIVGGGCNDRLLCQWTANACNKLVLAGPVDASALGNVMVQLIGAGELRNVRQGRQLIRESQKIQEYQPQNTAQWEAAYEEYCHRFGLRSCCSNACNL